MAKANNVEFFTRFQEAYPEFIYTIRKINPDLKVSELTLLAYFYLGFNNKDIAYYTYKSTFTIRNRKHNLRKKLNINSDEDFELYLKSILND